MLGSFGGGSLGSIGSIIGDVGGFSGTLSGVGNLGGIVDSLSMSGIGSSLGSVSGLLGGVTGSMDMSSMLGGSLGNISFGGIADSVGISSITSALGGYNISSISSITSAGTLDSLVGKATDSLGVSNVLSGISDGLNIGGIEMPSLSTDSVVNQLTKSVGLEALTSGTSLSSLTDDYSIGNLTSQALSKTGIDQLDGNVNSLVNSFSTDNITSTLSDKLGISNTSSELKQLSQDLSSTNLSLGSLGDVNVTLNSNTSVSKNGLEDLGKLETSGVLAKLATLTDRQIDKLLLLLQD